MPGRYEMVDEPNLIDGEADHEADEDVYQPNHTVSSMSESFQTLEPSFGGPITLKMLFYDPRWSSNQRRCCLGSVIVLFASCVAIMIGLFVGLGKVITFIQYEEAIRHSGLQFVPLPIDNDFDLLVCDQTEYAAKSDAHRKCGELGTEYVRDIEHILDEIRQQRNHPVEKCTSGVEHDLSDSEKFCEFDEHILFTGTKCTADNNYGFSTGEPCVLLRLAKITNIPTPMHTADKPISSNAAPAYTTSYQANFIGLDCSGSNLETPVFSSVYGFDMNFLPFSEKAGYVEPMVMVEFRKLFDSLQLLPAATGMPVTCTLLLQHPEKFDGKKEARFQFKLAKL